MKLSLKNDLAVNLINKLQPLRVLTKHHPHVNRVTTEQINVYKFHTLSNN